MTSLDNRGSRELTSASTSPASFFFRAAPQDEALARLEFLVDERRKLGLLSGPSGCGKTWVLQKFAQEQRRAGREVVAVDLLGTDGRELLWLLASRLRARATPQDPRFQLWRAIAQRLLENHWESVPTILLLDNVDQASDETAGLILRLLHLDEVRNLRMTIVLAVDDSGLPKFPEGLRELVDLRTQLEPWSADEVSEYLWSRLARIPEQPPEVVSAVSERLWQLSSGVPRQVCRLLELALVAISGQRPARLNAHVLDAVHRELTAVRAAS